MYFEVLLDALLGEREILHSMECPVCGFDEIYYCDPVTLKQLGRACQGCNFVQKFDF
ncbi:acyltransferase [Neobacillus mesonae]|uniref:acyltransferase n=1 Tax=Neobacillus mesonae TaxID=1193713 RepID=UPI00203D4F42|nr:acyltransferase [Neobacillus mesonae]MCM3569389.1 acyltransferase [Neobacillus mesonae]